RGPDRDPVVARRALGSRTTPAGVARAARRRRMGATVVAGRLVRAGSARMGRPGGRRRDRGCGCGGCAGRFGHVARSTDPPRARLRRAEAPGAAADRDRRGHLVPALQRARGRVGSRRSHHTRRAGQRRVGRERPEAVEHERAPRGLRDAAGADGLGRAEAPRHHLLRAPDEPARRRAPPPPADERPCVLQRGVPHRRAGAGRKVALTTLAHERGFGGLRRPVFAAATGRVVREAMQEAEAFFATYRWYPQRAGRPDLAVPLARDTGRSGDAVARQEIAALVAFQRAQEWTARRAQAARARGRPPGPEGSAGKLGASRVARASAAVHSLLAGADAMLCGPDSLMGGVVAEVLVSVPAQSIAGGTDEVQRNIIGERVLGLPKEPAPEADLPFRETRHGERQPT